MTLKFSITIFLSLFPQERPFKRKQGWFGLVGLASTHSTHSKQNASNLALVLPYFLIKSIDREVETKSQSQRIKSVPDDFLWIWNISLNKYSQENSLLRTGSRRPAFIRGCLEYHSPRRHNLFFWPHHMACGILVSQPGIEPEPLAVEGRSLNPWTTREVPRRHNLKHQPYQVLNCHDTNPLQNLQL